MKLTPHTSDEVREMLDVIGVPGIEDLFSTIPSECRLEGGLDLPPGRSEMEVLEEMKSLADLDADTSRVTSFVGAGAYEHHVPSVVRHLMDRGEFLTAYTPYQPELSQGTLQAQFEFQTMVARILGMDASNASMYEGATALAEACLTAARRTRRANVVVSGAVHPEYVRVLETYLGADRVRKVRFKDDSGGTDWDDARLACGEDTAALVVQSPNFFGVVEDLEAAASAAHEAGALSVATFTEPLAFGLIEPPGRCGADIAAGEGQSLGLPLSFGGPYVGLFGVRKPLVKLMPGRLVGMTTDRRGNRCYTLTLAAREQHIRRARATSNICTNEGLCAMSVAVYLSMLGREGYSALSRYNHARCERLKAMLYSTAGVEPLFSGPTFNEFAVRLPGRDTARLVEDMGRDGMVPGFPLGRFFEGMDDALLVCVTESRTDGDMRELAMRLAT